MCLKRTIFSPIYVALACTLLPAIINAAELAMPALADQARVSTLISFEAAALKTLAAHPQFRQFNLANEAARAREAQAALKPALELSGDLENVLGSQGSGMQNAELTVSLTSIFERGSKRAARTGVAQSASALLSVQQRIQALDLLAETGRSFILLAAAQESKAASDRALVLANATLEAIKQRVQAAQAPETESLNAEIVQIEAMLQVGHARREIEAAQHALALSWNEPDAMPIALMDIYAMPKAAEASVLIATLDALPDIAQYGAEIRVQRAQIALAKSQAVTDWRWSAGLRRLEAENDQAFVVGVSIPLGQARRQTSFVREAEINAQLPDFAAQEARRQLKKLLFATLKDLQSAISDEQAVRTGQLPQAKKVMTLTMRGYALGRYGYRDVALAQAQLQTLELKRLNAAQGYHIARIELERLTGAQLNLISE